jgi:predicted TIM-barrel fold metal-dependent hydrolase
VREQRIQALWERRAAWGAPVIDAHAHLGPYGRFFIADNGLTGLLAAYERAGVSLAVISSHLAIEQDSVLGNDATAEAVSASAGRLLGYAVVNPWQSPDTQLERVATDRRFVGVKLHPDLHEYALTGERYREVFHYSERTGCPVLVHTFAGSAYNSVEHLAALLEEHPAATVIAGHAGATMSAFDPVLELARRHSGLQLEVCGSYIDRRVIGHFLTELDGRQVLFGSDAPFIDVRVSLGRAIHLDATDEHFARFVGGNMRALLDWREGPRSSATNRLRTGTLGK